MDTGFKVAFKMIDSVTGKKVLRTYRILDNDELDSVFKALEMSGYEQIEAIFL